MAAPSSAIGQFISEHYQWLNAEKHRVKATWGSRGKYRLEPVRPHLRDGDAILDYGCGKATVSEVLEGVTCYDPNIPEHADVPIKKHDVVLCLDVMEHVEPDYVDRVLDHIAHLCDRVALFSIACRPASNKLPDGSNAHRSVHPPEWWRSRLEPRFAAVEDVLVPGSDCAYLCWSLRVVSRDPPEPAVTGIEEA